MSQPKRVAFQKFINAMRKLSIEVNDTEICKRLEILMATSKDDLPLAQVNLLLTDPKNFDPRSIAEPFTQYVRHFIYMVKRNGRVPADLGGNDGSNAANPSGEVRDNQKLGSGKKSSSAPKKKASSKKSLKK
ncbi:hypothetical protein EHQ58_04335 [Leptospira ognonensis]|uniref:Uncharacterized protein n=1 Tax=Leptospira ognonensis TaxID=2484945 RepID=A0A4R9K6F6_9LEPT|nr:hypothetical protein [Leptospira ognonensis]TGL61848.1 hypothetical protein EHQ58_04335 [Leptospira ognonensis]